MWKDFVQRGESNALIEGIENAQMVGKSEKLTQ
jgi:hypothetical protein